MPGDVATSPVTASGPPAAASSSHHHHHPATSARSALSNAVAGASAGNLWPQLSPFRSSVLFGLGVYSYVWEVIAGFGACAQV